MSGVITINASDRRKALADIGAAANYEELLGHLKHEQEHHQPYHVDTFMSVEMHTDIRVLEARFENLDKSVGVVSAKIDQLMSTQEHFIRLQEQHEQTRESLDRAILIINTMTNLASETDARLNKALYFIRGGASLKTDVSKFGGLALFLDGVDDQVIGVASDDYTFGTGEFTVEFWFYCGADEFLNRRMDEVRITKGVARYTSAFTIPTSKFWAPADPFPSNVSLLLHGSGTDD